MKHVLKKTVLLCFFCIMTILYYSCTQEKEFVNEHNHSKINYEEKSFKEALSLSLFNDALKKIAKKRGAFRSEAEAKTALEEQFGFTIVEDAPVRIVTDENGIIFYTILIERVDKVELVFENLMIQLDGEDVSAAIIRYTMAEKGVLSPTGEYTIKEITTTTYTDLNIEGKMFFNANGDTCFDWFVFKCDDQLGYTHTAYSACFNNNTAYPVLSTVCLGDNVAGNGETINVGGGDSGPSSNNNGGLGSSSGVPNNVPLSPIICRTGNCIEELFDNNCDKLQNLLKPEKQVVAAIASVRTNSVGFNGEKGARLSHSSTINPANNAVVHDYSVTSVSTTETVGNSHQLRININEFTYGFIHSHPVEVGVPKAVPMFSLYDLNALIRIYNTTLLENKQDVVFMLVIPGGDVYALKVDDIALLTTYVDSFNDIKDVKRVTDPIKKEVVKNKLFDKRCRNGTYDSDNENDKENKYVMGFLDEMRNKGLSLYRAVNPSAVIGWEKLTYPSPFSAQPTATPCQ